MKLTDIKKADYNSFYQRYIDLVGDDSLLTSLRLGLQTTHQFFNDIPTLKWEYRYAEDKWTPKDILQHIIDTERVFAYRALYFARANNADLKGFDENDFAKNALATNRDAASLLKEYVAVREATICLFESFSVAQLNQIGIANGSKMSVAAAGFIICGHEKHHCTIINERYLHSLSI